MWISAALGIAQLSAGVWLATLWLVGAPAVMIWALVLISFVLAGPDPALRPPLGAGLAVDSCLV